MNVEAGERKELAERGCIDGGNIELSKKKTEELRVKKSDEIYRRLSLVKINCQILGRKSLRDRSS